MAENQESRKPSVLGAPSSPLADPELQTYLTEHPDVVAKLRSGEMRVEHHIVYAKPDGSVWVERVKPNPDELHLDDLIPTTVTSTL